MPCTDKACEQALKKTKMCAYFRKGRCSRGIDCTFAHSPQELNNRPNLSKTRLCIPFQHSGTCSMGMACRFAHEERELRPIAKKQLELREAENRRSIQAARMPQPMPQPRGTPYQQPPQAFFHQGVADEYAELEVDRDFSRQSTFEDCMSNFSRQNSITVQEHGVQGVGYYRQTSPFVPTLATISRHQPVAHRRNSHSPAGSEESLAFYKSEDSEGQRIIRLMEHLIDGNDDPVFHGDEQVQNRLTKMDVYHNQAQNGTPNQRRLWDDLMGNNDGDDDALDGNWDGRFTKCTNSGEEDWRTISWFNESEGGVQDKWAENQRRGKLENERLLRAAGKMEDSNGDYSQYYNPMATHGAESGVPEDWETATEVADSGGGYSQYGSPKAEAAHNVLMFGRTDLNCNVQNTFLHFSSCNSSDSGDQKLLRRSNSLSALPLRGL